MASSSAKMMSKHVLTDTDRSISRRKRKKKVLNSSERDRTAVDGDDTVKQWKSDTQQQVYSSRLLQALRQVRSNSNGVAAPMKKRGGAVREAADRALAVTAKGRTRWSRAILTNRVKLSFMKKAAGGRRAEAAMRRTAATTVVTTGGSGWQKKPRVSVLRLKTKGIPAFQRKARVLGRLVPGCRSQPVPVILEEATDYIAALEMQVRAMTALAEMLAGASTSSPSS